MAGSFLDVYQSTQAAKSPANIGWQALAPAVALTSLAIIFVSLRWYTRLNLVRCVGWEDWMVTVAMLISIAMTIVIGFEVREDREIHVNEDVRAHARHLVPAISKLILAGNTLYQATINTTKSSILTQYLRIFNGSGTRVRNFCWLLLVLCFGAAMYGIFGGIFLCHPVKKYWTPWISGHCQSAHNYWVSAASIGMILDFTIWIFPMPLISQLRIPRKQMRGLMVVFALGGLTCTMSLIRLLVVHIKSAQQNYGGAGVSAVIWSACEANVGIICASLMAIKPLVIHFFPNLMNEKYPSKYSLRLPLVGQDTWPNQTAATRGTETTCTRTSADSDSHASRIHVTTETRQMSLHIKPEDLEAFRTMSRVPESLVRFEEEEARLPDMVFLSDREGGARRGSFGWPPGVAV